MTKLFFRLCLIILFIANINAQNTTILISFDAFRWDFTDRNITPNLQKLIDRGVKASSLQPCFPTKTFPNHYSIITGMYPENHGIIFNYIRDDFKDMTYSLSRRNEVKNSKWYQGEALWETAERQGIITASYFWPGSEVTLEHRHPTYYEKYDEDREYDKRINDILKWIDLPDSSRPEFISLYFEATDTYGHNYGPDSRENNRAIARLDSMLGKLESGLIDRDLLDKTNLIVVSDHGMTNISEKRIVNIEELLKKHKVQFNNSGPVMTIKPDPAKFLEVYQILKQNERNYKVYTKDNVPDHYHFNKHPFIYPIILVADMGWSLLDKRSLKHWDNKYSKGNHGYDNHQLDMHGIFVAAGPSFKNKYKCGTLLNIDIYPLLCKVFNIYPRLNIDGKLERIEFILKN